MFKDSEGNRFVLSSDWNTPGVWLSHTGALQFGRSETAATEDLRL